MQLSLCNNTIYGISDDVEKRAFSLMQKTSEQQNSLLKENKLINNVKLIYFSTEEVDQEGKDFYDDDFKNIHVQNGVLYKMNFVELKSENKETIYHGFVLFENKEENTFKIIRNKSFDWQGAACRYIDDWTCHHYRYRGGW